MLQTPLLEQQQFTRGAERFNSGATQLPLVGTGAATAGVAAAAETVTRLRSALASPPSWSELFASAPEAAESPALASAESSGNPASLRKISTDSAKLFFLRNCSTASSVCWSVGVPAPAELLPPAGAPQAGGGESSLPSLALLELFAAFSSDGSTVDSFLSTDSTSPP